MAGTEPPRWKVQFDDGELRDDIRLASPGVPVRFDAGAYGSTVEVRFDGEWYRGRLVELVSGSDVWGVAFENGKWAEDVSLGDPDVRYVFAGGSKRGTREDAGEGAGPERKRVREKGAAGPGGPRDEGQKRRGESATACFECDICGKAFSRADHLTVHMRTHSGSRPHLCETCGKVFSDSSNLAVHMRTHSGERPYVCETCGKACSDSSGLVSHMRVHSREKPYACETCGKAFSLAGNLAVHMRTHSGEKPCVCETCGKAFSQSGSLTRHRQSKH